MFAAGAELSRALAIGAQFGGVLRWRRGRICRAMSQPAGRHRCFVQCRTASSQDYPWCSPEAGKLDPHKYLLKLPDDKLAAISVVEVNSPTWADAEILRNQSFLVKPACRLTGLMVVARDTPNSEIW
jgi:hypothetical protein